jgi:hypothetical protein
MSPILPTSRAPAPEIRDAIQGAARRTGVSFDYLVRQAEAESGFDRTARAATSSATGLYQFIDATWLAMIRTHGGKYGLEAAAAALETGPPDPALRTRVLALREDPVLAAAMAAEYARSNQDRMRTALGREPDATDLYLGHFLGPAGAERFLRARAADGAAAAAALLPEAAAANRAVFFAPDGRPRSLDEVHDRFARRFAGLPPPTQAPPALRAAAARGEPAAPDAAMAPSRARALDIRVELLQALDAKVPAPLTILALAALDPPRGPGRDGKRG